MYNNIPKKTWNTIYSFLKTVKGLHIKNEEQRRCFLEAVWYVLRTGCQWRLLPFYYGHWRSIHKRYKSWSDREILADLMCSVSEVDDQSVMIDATIVRAHACASGYIKNGNETHALGRSKGGFTTKIHALVDALGNPIKFVLTAGNRNDITQAEQLLKEQRNTVVLADKGYDSQAFIDALASRGCSTVIPSKRAQKIQEKLTHGCTKKDF